MLDFRTARDHRDTALQHFARSVVVEPALLDLHASLLRNSRNLCEIWQKEGRDREPRFRKIDTFPEVQGLDVVPRDDERVRAARRALVRFGVDAHARRTETDLLSPTLNTLEQPPGTT